MDLNQIHKTLATIEDFEHTIQFSMKTQPDGSRLIAAGHTFPAGAIGPGELKLCASYKVKLPATVESGLEMAEGLGVDLGKLTDGAVEHILNLIRGYNVAVTVATVVSNGLSQPKIIDGNTSLANAESAMENAQVRASDHIYVPPVAHHPGDTSAVVQSPIVERSEHHESIPKVHAVVEEKIDGDVPVGSFDLDLGAGLGTGNGMGRG